MICTYDDTWNFHVSKQCNSYTKTCRCYCECLLGLATPRRLLWLYDETLLCLQQQGKWCVQCGIEWRSIDGGTCNLMLSLAFPPNGNSVCQLYFWTVFLNFICPLYLSTQCSIKCKCMRLAVFVWPNGGQAHFRWQLFLNAHAWMLVITAMTARRACPLRSSIVRWDLRGGSTPPTGWPAT